MSGGVPGHVLAERGFAVIRGLAGAPEEAARAPWSFAGRFVRTRPRMVERQPIKAVPGGMSFASTSGPTPLHTDSQLHAGAPPEVQVMVCVAAAERGGEHLLVDAWALLDRVRDADPELYRLLFEAPRRMPFVFGDVFGPTVALRGGALAFTHTPRPLPHDTVAQRLAPFVDAAPRIELTTRAGEILLVHNHRMLHGRQAFEGGAREYVRLLVWGAGELPAPRDHLAHAERIAAARAAQLSAAPEAVRRRLGLTEPSPAEGRLGVVLEMLRGVPPGLLAAREHILESELYRMRDVALAAAEAALAGPLPGGDDELARAIARRR